jgi:outer membrane protein OmpA-like peptidoglycan-associated protein
MQAEDFDQFIDEDGCPDLDNDNDSLTDDVDGCPNEAGPIENKGCPDTDRDGDGVVDRLDNCPDEKGSPDNFGCVQKQLVQITGTKLVIVDSVIFATAKAKIRRRSFRLLNNVADVIKAHPEINTVIVEGHTDDRGGDEYNLDLSTRRATAVVAYLVKRGVSAERLLPKGFGEANPVDSNKSKKGRLNNRRVEFTIK